MYSNTEVNGSTNQPDTQVKSDPWHRSPKSIYALDGLRAIAILLVIARHGAIALRPSTTSPTIGGWSIDTPLINGWMGVDLFFVLSGFLITIHLVKRYGARMSKSEFVDYGKRRAYRIIPAYAVTILIAISGLIPYFNTRSEDLLYSLTYHSLFLQDYLPADILVVLWSLGVEEKFYILAPLISGYVLFNFSVKRQIFSLGLIALTPAVFRLQQYLSSGSPESYLEFFETVRSPFHTTFEGLILGMVAGVIYLNKEQLNWTNNLKLVKSMTVTGWVIFGILLFSDPHLDSINAFDAIGLQMILGISSMFILLGLTLDAGPIKLLSGFKLFVIAKLSYSWYLVHMMFIPLALVTADSLGDANWIRVLSFVVIYLVTSLGLSVAIYRFVELPALDLRDRNVSEAKSSNGPGEHTSDENSKNPSEISSDNAFTRT